MPSPDYLLPDLFVSPTISWVIRGGWIFRNLPPCGRDFVLPGQDWSCQEGGQEKGQEEHCRAHVLELPTVLPDGCPGKRMGWESCSQPNPGAIVWFPSLLLHPGFPRMSPESWQGWRTQPMVPVGIVHLIPSPSLGGWGWQTLLCSGFRRSRDISVRCRGCCREGAARETPPAPLACPRAQPEAPVPVPSSHQTLHHVVLPQ